MRYFYKILHYVLGWDFIFWAKGCKSGTARLFVTKDDRVCFWTGYESEPLVEIKDELSVVWLTCTPEKYSIGSKE